MTRHRSNIGRALERVRAALIADILTCSDAEILAEAAEDGLSASGIAGRMRDIVSHCLQNSAQPVTAARAGSALTDALQPRRTAMPALRKFIIERDIPGAGSLEREQLKGAAAKSNGVLRQLGPDIQWVESYVAADKTFCVYLAKDEDIIKKHAEISGFPASKITEIRKMIDPTTEQTG